MSQTFRCDVLADLSAGQRRRQLNADRAYVGFIAASLSTGWIDVGDGDERIIVGRRVDLDDPYVEGSDVAACRDCDCDVQYRLKRRPTHSAAICVSCVARRFREHGLPTEEVRR